MTKLINISNLSKLLDLVNEENKPKNHILRFWEKKFKQIRPKILNGRRYYSKKQMDLIKLIKFLLKDKGLTIKGVKNVLKSNINSLDDYDLYSLKADYFKQNIKSRSKSILVKIKKLKR